MRAARVCLGSGPFAEVLLGLVDRGGQTVGSPELLNLSLGCLLHFLADLVDLRAKHVIQLAVVPNKLDIVENFLVSGVLARHDVFFYRA